MVSRAECNMEPVAETIWRLWGSGACKAWPIIESVNGTKHGHADILDGTRCDGPDDEYATAEARGTRVFYDQNGVNLSEDDFWQTKSSAQEIYRW